MVDFRLALDKWYNVIFAFNSNQHNSSFLLYFKDNNTVYRRQVFPFIISTNILQTETIKHTIKVTLLLFSFLIVCCFFLNAASFYEVNAPYRLLDPLNVLLKVANYGIHVLFCLLGTDKSKWTKVREPLSPWHHKLMYFNQVEITWTITWEALLFMRSWAALTALMTFFTLTWRGRDSV